MFQIRTKISNVPIPHTTNLTTFVTNQISLKMEPQQKPKRPTCPNCSKPLALCLCTRFQTPTLDNKVHVTILQHSLETKHPLNSARIAKLGLKNVDIFTVTDVMFDAQFDIQPLRPGSAASLFGEECTSSVCENDTEGLDRGSKLKYKRSRKRGFYNVSDIDSGPGFTDVSDSKRISGLQEQNVKRIAGFDSNGGALETDDDCLLEQCAAEVDAEVTTVCDDLTLKDAVNEDHKALLCVKIGKYGKISSVSHQWELQNEGKALEFEHFFSMPEALDFLAGGFVVRKLQTKQKSGSLELEQFEEFRITVPPGSALLFPAEKAVPAEAINFEVTNLIVLDGTWAKANRMYNENPWLKILPAVRLNVEKASMFSEVRHQPKLGYLSTIESIVYALKALGRSEKLEGLDNLLDVFESMVEDQRRFKDQRVKKVSQ